MEVAAAEQMLLHAEESSELANVFRVVADAEWDGIPKFSTVICRDLVRTIVCRVYAPPLLELCHLVSAAERCAGGYTAFFWGSGPARTAAFRSFTTRKLCKGTDVRATKAGLEHDYKDGAFVVTYTRMPFLSALMEFLVSALGYRAVDKIVGPLGARHVTAKAADQAAKALASAVYAYLKDNLLSAQNQRKFRRVIGFLSQADDVSPEAVDDDVIMRFWLAESSADDRTDFKTYKAVFFVFLRFVQALAAARDQSAIENAKVLGTDRAAGEIEPANLAFGLEPSDEAGNPLDELEAPPCEAIRFLTKAERRMLELLVECGQFAERLPLSFMRCFVFGTAQGRITQGLRRRLDASALLALIETSAVQDYQDCHEGFDALTAHVERMLLATLHALSETGRDEAVCVLLGLRPALDFTPLAAGFAAEAVFPDGVVSLHERGAMTRLLSVVVANESLDEPLRALAQDAKAAFSSVSRRGFGQTDLRDDLIADGFAGACKPLLALRGCLVCFTNRLEGNKMSSRHQFEADRAVFVRQFHLLYGADS